MNFLTLDYLIILDFVLVAVPSHIVVSVIEHAVQKKAKTALIFSSGFSEESYWIVFVRL